MIIAIIVGAVVLAIAVWEAAEKLGTALQAAIGESTQIICEAVADAGKGTNFGYRSRMIQANEGTLLAYVSETTDDFEIVYVPVLAFVEGEGGGCWSPLTLMKGGLHARVFSASIYSTSKLASALVLQPGECLSEQECAEMKKQYREDVELDRELAAKRTLGSDDDD